MKRRRGGLLLIAIGAVLVFGAIGLSVYNVWDASRAAAAAFSAMKTLDRAIKPVGTSDPKDFIGADGETEIPDYILDPNMEIPVLEVDGNRYIGYLEIPVLELTLPVLEKWSYPNLKVSACRYTGSPYRDNMVVAAHNYTQHFGRLDRLRDGDEVRFTDVDGNVFVYAVLDQEQIEGSDILTMVKGVWDLTLFTCTLSGQSRQTVRCIRV